MVEEGIQRNDETAGSSVNLELKDLNMRTENDDLHKVMKEGNKEVQHTVAQNKGQGISSNSKGKNIMDKFIKARNKDKSTPLELLKQVLLAPLNHKFKRSSLTKERAKALMITPDLNKPIQFWVSILGGTGERLLNVKPPDPEIQLSMMGNSLVELQQKKSLLKGTGITGK